MLHDNYLCGEVNIFKFFLWDVPVADTLKKRHTNTFRKEKSSSTPAAGFAVALGVAAVDVGNAGIGAGVVVVLAVVVVVAVVVMVVVVRAVIMLEFLTISARNFARVDGKEPLWGSISWIYRDR